MAGLGTQLAIERAGLVTPRLPVRAPWFYPDSPTGGDCPVDTVVIPGGEKGDRLVESPGVKVSKGGEQLGRS